MKNEQEKTSIQQCTSCKLSGTTDHNVICGDHAHDFADYIERLRKQQFNKQENEERYKNKDKNLASMFYGISMAMDQKTGMEQIISMLVDHESTIRADERSKVIDILLGAAREEFKPSTITYMSGVQIDAWNAGVGAVLSRLESVAEGIKEGK